jgi:hypothetical protein
MKPNDIARVLGEVCSDKDWPEDFNHENGRYQCRCVVCGGMFYGHKRRVVCKECATTPKTAKCPK